jgi:biopolymer transport protein ExbD
MQLIRARKVKLSLDLAPLIDVVFQLLVFFMLTASFAAPTIPLVLPKATSGKADQPQNVSLSLKKNGEIFLNDKPVGKDELQSSIRSALEKARDKSVAIRGEVNMPYQFFVEAIDTARKSGASQILIVHEKAK